MPGTLCKMSARVRWPYFLASSAVMIVTEEGASVIFCLYFEAASTTGISILVISSTLRSVGSGGCVSTGFFSSATSPLASAAPNARMRSECGKPTRRARRHDSGEWFTAKAYREPRDRLQAVFSATGRHFLQNLDAMRNRANHKTQTLHGAAGFAGQTNHQRLVHDHREVA